MTCEKLCDLIGVAQNDNSTDRVDITSCLVRGGSEMAATPKSIGPMNRPGCATAGSLEVTQRSNSCHISNILSKTLQEAFKALTTPRNKDRTSSCFWLPLFCETIWKARRRAGGLLKMSSSSRSVRYRMVSNKDDLVDSEINQVGSNDQHGELMPKSRLTQLFDRQT